MSLLGTLVFIQILYLESNSLVIALPNVASTNGIILLPQSVNTTTHSVRNDFGEAIQPSLSSVSKSRYEKYNLYNTKNGKTILSQGELSRHGFKNYSQVYQERKMSGAMRDEQSQAVKTQRLKFKSRFRSSKLIKPKESNSSNDKEVSSFVDPNGRQLQTFDPNKSQKPSTPTLMRSASRSTGTKEVHKTENASVVDIKLKRFNSFLRSRIKRGVKGAPPVKGGKRKVPTTATPLVMPAVVPTNATTSPTIIISTVHTSLLSASSDNTTFSDDPYVVSTASTNIETSPTVNTVNETASSDNTTSSHSSPSLAFSTSSSDLSIITSIVSTNVTKSTFSVDPLETTTASTYLRTSTTFSSHNTDLSDSVKSIFSTSYPDPTTEESSVSADSISHTFVASVPTIDATITPTFLSSTAYPSVTNTASSIVSPCVTYSCSSECELWPWLLFVIFLCLLILFMLMLLVFYVSKLLSTRNVFDNIDFNSSCNTVVSKQVKPFVLKGNLETFTKGQTKSNVLEPQIDSSSLRFVSSDQNKVDVKKSVVVNENVQKSLDVANVRQSSLWNMDKDLLTSSGRNENSYMEYKEIQRCRPRSVVFNVTSTTLSGSHPSMTTKSKEVADYHIQYQKEDLKKLEEGASVFKNTSKSSSNILDTSSTIDPDEVISISSCSKHSKRYSNDSNSLTVPPSTPTEKEQIIPTLNVQKVSKSAIMEQSSRIPLSQQANDDKSQTLTYSLNRKMETEKLKRDFLNISDSGNLISPNNQQHQHHSFIGTYNRLQKRLEMERQRSKSGENISYSTNIIDTAAVGERFSSSSATSTMISKSVNSSASTRANSCYYTYSKGQGTGESVLIVNKDEGWFKLETGSSVSPGNVTKVHKIIQIDSKQKQSSSSGATIATHDTTL